MPPVLPWSSRFSRFLIRQTAMPYTGPRPKEASRAGTSDTSIFTKLGMSAGRLKSKNISTVATAESMAVSVSLRNLELFCMR